MNDQDDLGLARRQRDELRRALTRAQTGRADAERTLADARSRFGDEDRRTAAARAAAERAAGAFDETHEAWLGARNRVADGLRVRVDRDIADDFSALETSLPLVLLPLRLETRFASAGDTPELWIRVYPDEIHADAHEHELTEQEAAAGRAYWTAVWRDDSARRTAWQVLLEIVPTPRAAWVVRVMTPRNVDGDHAASEPDFPEPTIKIGDWTRAAEARLLPDRFVALGFRAGQEVARHPGRGHVEPLAVTMAPDAAASQRQDVSGDGLEVDEAVRWTVDFERAVEVGMGLRMRLSGADIENGFDELLVVGVKGSLPPRDTSAELAALFDEHHYGRGLAFVAQGTPTNNTERAPSGFPPADPHGERSFAIELDPARSVAGRDGERFARALGIPAATMTHVDRSNADEQAGARAMCGALWPATWGYFFEELLFVDDLDDEVDAFRDYFIDHVRARGHYPAFRVGSTPYGVVVASSLARWRQRGRKGLIENAMPDDLRRLREIWREAAPNVPRVGRTADPDRDLIEVLEMDASAREVRVRSVVGPNASLNLAAFFALNWDPARAKQLELASRLAQRLGRNDVGARVFSLTFGTPHPAFARGFVVPKPAPDQPEPLSETDPLPFNYIQWLREAPSIDDVRQERLPAGVAPPNTLLYLLLRHAMLREAARTADTILVRSTLVERAATRDHELVAAFATPAGAAPAAAAATATVWDRMQMTVPQVTGNLTLASFVWRDVAGVQETRRLREYREYLKTLESLPTAELERLLTETLDVCSHRLDAWVTSMFDVRLTAMRQAGNGASVVGAYGWVIGLRARPSTSTTLVPTPQLTAEVRRRLGSVGPSLPQQTSTGGFVQTPSMAQAAAAAVLRNGFLSRRTVNAQRYGVDLSSARVRRARFILDAVRQGQSFGAVLGYQFERGLHEGHRPLQLDRYKEPFRRAYPLVAGKLTPTDAADGESVEAVAARNVVDGLALHAGWQKDEIAWGQDGKPVRPGDHFSAVDVELRRLDETIDAVADVLMAESVYQLVRGNTAGASSSLDSLARGVRAPDPEVVKTPRGGTAITHRAALVLGGTPLAPAGWDTVAATPRSTAEPHLDGWLGALVGDPSKVRCSVSYTNNAAPPAVSQTEVTLAQLGLRPIDVLHAVAAAESEEQEHQAEPTATAQASELDSRVAAVALARSDANPRGEVKIAYAPTDRASTRSFPELAELLRSVQAVLSTARALEPKDLLASAQSERVNEADVDEAQLVTRAGAALTALTTARNAIVTESAPLAAEPTPVNADRTKLVAALRAAALFGVPGAFVAVPHTDTATPGESATQQQRTRELVQRATSVASEMTRRIEAATAETAARAKIGRVFGEAFVPLVRFTPVTDALSQALAQGPSPAPTRAEMREWLRGAALVRSPLDRYHRLTLLQRALGSTPATLTATQVPHVPGAGWVALPFADEASRHASGTLSLALFGGNGALPGAADRWVGLLLDEWTELVPNREESTAVAFHYDDPGAEAPHAVLVAVPPDAAANWTLETVSDVLRETLESARLRLVDGDMLGVLSPLLPATYLASNSKFDTVAVRFDGLVQKDAVILRASS
jgi:hypothetical protein